MIPSMPVQAAGGGSDNPGILRTELIAGFPRGTRNQLLPLLPSGSDGVGSLPLRGTQLSVLSVKVRRRISGDSPERGDTLPPQERRHESYRQIAR